MVKTSLASDARIAALVGRSLCLFQNSFVAAETQRPRHGSTM